MLGVDGDGASSGGEVVVVVMMVVVVVVIEYWWWHSNDFLKHNVHFQYIWQLSTTNIQPLLMVLSASWKSSKPMFTLVDILPR